MDQYNQNVAIVLAFLKERGYTKQTIRRHEIVYDRLGAYLLDSEQEYSPELGRYLLANHPDDFFLSQSRFGDVGCIAKLNDVYTNGRITYALACPRKRYSLTSLERPLLQPVSEFLESKDGIFKPTQVENARRRCILFMKYMQARGIHKASDITYEGIRLYHRELSHLKRTSRIVEESTLHQFLLYLADSGYISYGPYLYMYALETDTLVTMDDMSPNDCRLIEGSRNEGLSFPADEFLEAGLELIALHCETGYAQKYTEASKRAVLQLYLFLDLHGLGYSEQTASAWLHSDAVKAVIQGSSWNVARRILFVFSCFVENGQHDFAQAIPRGISGINELPEWCATPLLDYAECRRKTKVEENTVKNDIYSILRFCRFIMDSGLDSYNDVTGETLAEYNLKDIHDSPEGKNACNGRIRHFLKYLYREGIITSPSLHLALGYSAAPIETIVVTLTAEEVETIRSFVENATTDLEIRDSAIVLLGTEMGMRGSDIANLRIQDVNWGNRSIRFCQSKTDTDAWIPMPVAVGNAIFRYLRVSRPRKAKNEHIFVDFKAPFKPLTRCICYGALKRILPDRNVKGSGFHVTRKTFSTNRLRNGVRPAEIADSIGQRGTESLAPYLSLDDEHMAQCPLSLADLAMPAEGRVS